MSSINKINYEYCDTKTTKNILNVCTKTLQYWSNTGLIETKRTQGNRRRYNVKKYCDDNNLSHLLSNTELNPRKKIIYCRVSSHDRKEDLERQIEYLLNKFDGYEVISDIGSGINFKRRGLQKLIELAINNQVEEVVINYKDRLCRIGYELIEMIIQKYSKGKITIVHPVENNRNEEITKDLIEIITVYSSKIHGTRNNKKE